MDDVSTFIANLKKAIANREDVTIGGGIFNRDELLPVLRLLQEAVEVQPPSTGMWREAGENLETLLKLKRCRETYPDSNPRFDLEGGTKSHVGLAKSVLRVLREAGITSQKED